MRRRVSRSVEEPLSVSRPTGVLTGVTDRGVLFSCRNDSQPANQCDVQPCLLKAFSAFLEARLISPIIALRVPLK